MAEIKKTTNYEMFKKLDINRPINKGHLARLKFSIQKNNLLEFRPIMVNEKMQVIDGQHRLEAAKLLDYPVYYQIQKDQEETDIILLNATIKAWSLDDYVNFYVKKGKPEYIKFQQVMKSYDLSANHLVRMMAHTAKTLKSGNLPMPDLGKIEDIMTKKDQIIHLLKIKLPWDYQRYKRSSFFSRALMLFLDYSEVDFQKFYSKLETQLSLLRLCTNVKDYVKNFQDIYNWRNQHPVDVIPML